MQIPYLARHLRVVTFDGHGNGKSGRPAEADAYAESEFVKDTLAVMDVTETQSACSSVFPWVRSEPCCWLPITPIGWRAPCSSGPPCRSHQGTLSGPSTRSMID